MTTEAYNANPLVTIGSDVDVLIFLLLLVMLGAAAVLVWSHFATKTK